MIEFSKYILEPIAELNRFSTELKTREGVILKQDSNYFDYHPWEQFGDLCVDEFLKSIKVDPENHLVNKGFSLWNKRKHISHKPFLNHILNKHGDVSKIKFKNDDHLINFLDLAKTDSMVRVDFNNLYSFEEVETLWTKLNTSQKRKIEYFEDPCPKGEKWLALESLGITIASDRNKKDGVGHSIDIFKPNVDLALSKDRVQVFSSYMGHDLGRYLCYLELMECGDLNIVHGIDTPHIYENQLELFSSQENMLVINQECIKTLEANLETMSWSTL